MRTSVKNGNGATCDICHTLLEPNEIIKIRQERLINKTGIYRGYKMADLCEDCFDKLKTFLKIQ